MSVARKPALRCARHDSSRDDPEAHSLAGEKLSGLDSGRDGEGLWFGNTDSIFLEVFNKNQVVDEH